jgi:pyruvate,orthophosphate dikinase
MASFSSTRRARTWWPASAPRKHHREGPHRGRHGRPSLESLMPETFAELIAICDRLEKHYRDMQDLEFTIQDGKLWMLQTRSGKRTAQGRTQDCRGHGRRRADHEELKRSCASTRPRSTSLLHPTHRPACGARHHRHRPAGLARCCVRRDRVRQRRGRRGRAQGRKVILVRVETSPEDIHGMHAAEGILTTRGGMTSHAAVVARGMGKPCVSGAGSSHQL